MVSVEYRYGWHSVKSLGDWSATGQMISPSDGLSYLRELVDQARGTAAAFLLLNICLGFDLTLAATDNLRSLTMPTPLGNAGPLVLVGTALASFTLIYFVTRFLLAVALQGLAQLRYKKIVEEVRASVRMRRDFAKLRDLDVYLNVVQDEALNRGFRRQERIIEDIESARDNSAVALSLWIIQLVIPGALGNALFATLPTPVYILVTVAVCFTYSWRSLQPGYRMVWTPGKGEEIYSVVHNRSREIDDEPPGERSLASSYNKARPLRGEPVEYDEPFEGVAEGDWGTSN